MKTHELHWITQFIWGITDDVLRDLYVRGKYRDVILPMTVLRRLDAVLEGSKKNVLERKASLDAAGIADQESALRQASGEAFYNTSKFTLRDLRHRASPQELHDDFIAYLDGFSPNVQEILQNFDFRHQLPRLSRANALGTLLEKFLDPAIHLGPTPILSADGTVKQPGLDNHAMGTVFEELIRRFNEDNNEETGEHWTPRDAVQLMASLLFLPIADSIESGAYLLYDGACGTGGMLTVADETLHQLAREHGKQVSTHIYGQEINPETHAIAKADFLLKGEGHDGDNLVGGPAYSTLSNDAFPDHEFDFMLSNPPYGKSWKSDLDRLGGKKAIQDPRFVVQHHNDPAFSLITRSSDGQMLFLANMVAKMRRKTRLGSRIATVHNGSSLLRGDAGQGESNIRRWIIENDWLEAIIGLPQAMFYNTPMETYIWVITNRKPSHRKGRVQLIDATEWHVPLQPSLGQKRVFLSESDVHRICETHLDFEDSEHSQVIPNEALGFWKVQVHRPLRLAVLLTAEPLAALEADTPLHEAVTRLAESIGPGPHRDFNGFMKALRHEARSIGFRLKAGHRETVRATLARRDPMARAVIRSQQEGSTSSADPVRGLHARLNEEGNQVIEQLEADRALGDVERVPLNYPGGCEQYFSDKIATRYPDAWINWNEDCPGYRVPFQKIFARSPSSRSLEKVRSRTDEVVDELHRSLGIRKASLNQHQTAGDEELGPEAVQELSFGQRWMGEVPSHWRIERAKHLFGEFNLRGQVDEPLLSVTQNRGVIARTDLDTKVVMPAGGTEEYKLVLPGDYVISLRSFQGGIELSRLRGLVSPAYVVVRPIEAICKDYFRLLFKSPRFIAELASSVSGVRQGKTIKYADFSEILLPVPPIDEQESIARTASSMEELAETSRALSQALDNELWSTTNDLVVGKASRVREGSAESLEEPEVVGSRRNPGPGRSAPL